jgi:Fe-S cluster assembly iron-binding protein IscA
MLNVPRRKKVTPIITLTRDAVEAIKLFLSEIGYRRPLRIDLQNSGCCDPSLCLRLDNIRESDLIQEVDELTFVISPENNRLVGEVTIAYCDEADRKGFVITSKNPISEWDGFGVSDIKI